ncbi:MAG: class I SAM-dependent methyltransferase [Clostridia bacterium]|nr:class I SAM-dependent methyltransferase [Clostridia bacterium]
MYENFFDIYDKLMFDADYEKRAEYVLSLFCKYDKKPSLMLDLCCGTGNFSSLFAKNGIEIIGVDVSQEMLSVAKQKASKQGEDILYLCQNATELDLYGTVDGAVCLMDSLNHITDYEDFCKAVANVSLFLEKDRLFIFDLNTVYKAEKILGNNTFVSEEEGIFLSWVNEYDNTAKTNNIYLDIFSENSDGTYTRTSENITERAYDEMQIEQALSKAGLKILAVLDDMKKTPPTKDSQRVFYITKKL